MPTSSTRGSTKFAPHDLSSVPEIEEVFEKLPDNSSIEVEVQREKNAFVCELRCMTSWGKFVARRVDLTLADAMSSACRSILRSVRFVRRSLAPTTGI